MQPHVTHALVHPISHGRSHSVPPNISSHSNLQPTNAKGPRGPFVPHSEDQSDHQVDQQLHDINLSILQRKHKMMKDPFPAAWSRGDGAELEDSVDGSVTSWTTRGGITDFVLVVNVHSSSICALYHSCMPHQSFNPPPLQCGNRPKTPIPMRKPLPVRAGNP
jgi:hypothetical protein